MRAFLRVACLCLLLLAKSRAARADDWLAVLPACDAVLSRDVDPAFEIAYPRPGLPALVAAGQTLIARVRLPSPLTPPPGVQQERALAGFDATLIGHARAVGVGPPAADGARYEHRHELAVVNVRPDGPASLVYRVSLPIPAWVAPGTYDLALSAPGGSGRARSLVRVLEPGKVPRAAWVASSHVPETLAVAGLPFDVWVRSAGEIEGADRDEPDAQSEAARAPLLDPRGLSAALRIDGRLWVIGGCESPHVRFVDEVASVLAGERRALHRATPPASTEHGFAPWGAAPRFSAWPPADALRIDGGRERVRIRAASALASAEISVLLAGDGRGARTDFGTLRFFPGADVASRLLVAQLQLSGPGEAHLERTQVRAAPALLVRPLEVQSGEIVHAGVAPGARGFRVAYRFDERHTAFTAATATHAYQTLGVQRVDALLIAQDGAASRAHADVRVRTAQRVGCRCQLALGPARPSSWLWSSTWVGFVSTWVGWARHVRRRRNRARKAPSAGGRE